MTGQFADDRPVPDLRSMIASGTTIALYMPGPDAQATVEKLASAGVPRHTPCAVISRASTSAQQTSVTTLEKLASIRAQAKPSILILGDVVRLSKLDFQALSAELISTQIPEPRQEAELA
jgi:siroheme synthase